MSNFESLSNRYRNFLTGNPNPPFKKMSNNKLIFMDDTQLTISEEKDDSEGKEVYIDEKKDDNKFYKILIVVSIIVGVIGLGYAIKKMTDRTNNDKDLPRDKNKGLPPNIIQDMPLSSIPSSSSLDNDNDDDDKKNESLIRKNSIIRKENVNLLPKKDIFKNNIDSIKKFIKRNKKYSRIPK